ncbi:uncharacterized protein [Mobula birostris]|uniref:uncharacterized protein isoform X1 n=1 Tax=Mobula birostris TaxID=1983395 RepID=UPI003B28543D
MLTEILRATNGGKMERRSPSQLLDGNKSLVIRSASRSDCGTYTCNVTNPVSTVQANYSLAIHGLLLADIIIVVSSITGIISSTVSLTGLIILYYLSRELKQGSQKPLFICNDLSLVTISIALIFRIVLKGAASEAVVVLVVVFALLAFNVCLAISFWNLGCECVRKFIDCTDVRTLINFCGIMSSIIVLVFSIVILAEEIHQSNRGCHVTYLTWSTLSLWFTVVAIIFSACFTVLWKGGEGSSRESEHQVTPQEEDEGQARNKRIGITAEKVGFGGSIRRIDPNCYSNGEEGVDWWGVVYVSTLARVIAPPQKTSPPG